MIERDFYWINPQSVVIPKGKLQEKIKGLPFKGIRDNRLSNFSWRKVECQSSVLQHVLMDWIDIKTRSLDASSIAVSWIGVQEEIESYVFI